MSWDIKDRFPSWGSTGTMPPAGKDWGVEQVREDYFDALWDSINKLEDNVETALVDIDSDKDGVVDKANAGAAPFTLDGDLVATNGEVVWDESATEIPDAVMGSIATTTLAADTDDDGLIEDYDETLLKDGNSRELDAAELAGSDGASGEVLTSDGAAASWSSVSGADPLYGDGNSGSVTDSANTTRGGVLRTTDYTLQSGNTLTVDTVLVILATDTITIDGTIDANGAANNGTAGTTAKTGDTVSDASNGGNGILKPIGLGGAGGGGGSVDAGDGGDGGDGDTTSAPLKLHDQLQFDMGALTEFLRTDDIAAGGGGGGGGVIASGASNNDGGSGSFAGGGGGGASDDTSSSTVSDGGDGGDGGGAVILCAPTVDVTGTIQADGIDGGDSASADVTGGAGGGGSGGLVYIRAKSLEESTPTYSATAGLGGTAATGNNSTGGDGADGATGEVIKIIQ